MTGRWLLLVALLVTVALRVPLLEVPLERDEGEYAYIAWRMDCGDVPYRDAFDQKPPGVFAAYWATFHLLGDSVWDIRFGLLLWTLGSVLAVGALGSQLAGAVPGGLAALAFGVASSSPALLAHAANTEIYMVLPLTLSALFLLRGLERERRQDWLLAGALAMAAFWFKQVAATGGLFVLLAACVARGELRARLRRVSWLGVGALTCALPVVGAFVAVDAWRPFLDAVILHNLGYVQATDLSTGIANLGRALAGQLGDSWALWALALLGIVHGLSQRRFLRPMGWALCWTVFLGLGVCSGLFFREHYFIQWLPGLCVLAGLGGAALAHAIREHRGMALGLSVTALCLVLPPAAARWELLREDPDAIARTLYGSNPFPEARLVAELIEAGSTPEDTVFILGSEPQILFLAKRRSASRYIFTYPLTGGFADSVQRQHEALAEIEAADPLYIVAINNPMSHLRAPGAELPLFDALNARVAGDYQLEAMLYAKEVQGIYPMLKGERARRFLQRNAAAMAELSSVSVYRRVDT